jgi:hypothetical protein
MTPTYFTHEPAVLAALSTIPELLVRSAVAADEAVDLSTTTPTAVVVFEADEVIQARKDACLVNRRVSIYLLIQGPSTERQPEDGELLHSIWATLHGLDIPGYEEPLMFESSDAEVVSGCRDYRLVFKTQVTLRKPGRPR